MSEDATGRQAQPSKLQALPLSTLRDRLELARIGLQPASMAFRKNALRELDECVAEYKRRGFLVPK